jgi:diguanylate cyclase (GGDEF)-like protein/PAS domain S-box-containing protein
MKPRKSLRRRDPTEEIYALIKTLRDTDQRLEVLMAGEVDAVADPDGRTYLLRRAQDRLRQSEAAKQDTILSELRESERRFSDMLRNMQLISLMLDREGRITYCNDYLLRLTGWRLEEVIGEDWFKLFVPPEIEDLSAHYAALLANRPEAWLHENEIFTRSGERRLIRWNNSVLRSGDGDVIGTASIGEDITERRRFLESLRRNEEQMRLILESVGDGIYGIDLEGRIFFKNSGAAKMLGYDPGELFGKSSHDTLHHSRKDGTPYPVADCPINRSMLYGVARRVEDDVFWRKDGSSFSVEYTTAPIRNAQEELIGAVVAFRDITNRKEAEIRIRRLNRVYAVLSGINTLIVRVRDRDELFQEACRIAVEAGAFKMAWIGVIDSQTLDGTVVAWHGAEQAYVDGIKFTAREGTPYSERLACRAIRELKPVICNDIAKDPTLVSRRDELLGEGCNSFACFPLAVDGRPEAVIALFATECDVFDDEEMRLLLELVSNITFALDHIEKEKKLNYLAYYDVLTGLANRSLFLERLAQSMRSAVANGHKLALFLVDLERFKNINDSLGQSAGDALLKQVAQWLTGKLGDANLLARVGANLFAAVLPEVEQAGDAARFLEKTMRALSDHPFRLNDTGFHIAAKVGVALVPDDGADADAVFKHAEAALNKAKARGDRYLFYTEKMTEAVARTLTLENQLRQAVDNEEFVLHYQPKVSLISGKLTSAEALIRWNDPRTGLVPPGRFIPLLEQTGLIHEVGRWALRTATEDYLRWCRAGLAAVRLSVNVSPLQLRQRGFIAEVTQTIGIDAHAAAGLELEITENLIMEDVEHSISSLQAIRAMGVSIAIDDFGTGFSSLSYLSKLPVDTLKIDRSFITDMTVAPQGVALVGTIITLAHALKLNVVAEGVETEEQSRLLQSVNCDEMQGYLFSKPVPRETFESKFLFASPTT